MAGHRRLLLRQRLRDTRRRRQLRHVVAHRQRGEIHVARDQWTPVRRHGCARRRGRQKRRRQTWSAGLSYSNGPVDAAGGYYYAANRSSLANGIRTGWNGTSDGTFDGSLVNGGYISAKSIGIARGALRYNFAPFAVGIDYSNALYKADAMSAFRSTQKYDTARGFQLSGDTQPARRRRLQLHVPVAIRARPTIRCPPAPTTCCRSAPISTQSAHGNARTANSARSTAARKRRRRRSGRMAMAERARRASSISGCATGSDHGGMTRAT